MNTAALPKSPSLKEGGLRTALRLGSSGDLDVMRITKALPGRNGELVFAGVPARHGSKARGLVVRFTTEGIPPAPRFDALTGQVHLYYPDRDHPEVQGLLNGKRERFCYFWRSAKGGRTHAWLLSSK